MDDPSDRVVSHWKIPCIMIFFLLPYSGGSCWGQYFVQGKWHWLPSTGGSCWGQYFVQWKWLVEKNRACGANDACGAFFYALQIYRSARFARAPLDVLIISMFKFPQIAWIIQMSGCISQLNTFTSTHRGARTHDHKVKSLALCRLS